MKTKVNSIEKSKMNSGAEFCHSQIVLQLGVVGWSEIWENCKRDL